MAESLLSGGDRVAEVHRSPAFAHIVAVPGWDLNFHIALHDALAAQARAQCQTSGHIEPVTLVVIHLGKIFHSLRHDDVAGSTGAVAAASVFQVNAVVQADIQYRLGLAVLLIWKLSLLEFYCLSVNRDLRQASLYRAHSRCLLHTGKTCFIPSKSKLPDV